MCPSIYPAARLLAAARVLGPPGLSLSPALWTPQNKNTMYPDSNTGRWFLRAHHESGLDPQGHSLTLRWHARCHSEEIILHTQTCQNTAMSLQVNGLWCFGITCIVWNTKYCEKNVVLPSLMLRLPSRRRRSNKAQTLRAPRASRFESRLATLKGHIQLLST